MRQAAVLALILALQAAPAAQSRQTPPLQADPVVRLLADLEAALESGRLEDLQALLAPGLPPASTAPLRRVLALGPVTSAVVRERARRPAGAGYDVLAEVLITRGRDGRIATWQIGTRPREGSTDRYEVTGLTELASVDGLLRLGLDRTRQFAMHDFTFEAPDLTLKMRSGAAFVAESDSGVTALVLHGKGELHFTPPDAAEQGQLRIFADHPSFDTTVEDAFIRLSPAEFLSRVGARSLVPETVDPDELSHAESIFDQFAPKTYTLDLGDLSSDRWSLEPGLGSVVVEFKSRHHGWLTYTRSPSDAEDIAFFDRTHHHNLSVYASAAKLAARGPFYSENDGLTYEVEHYGLDVMFDPERSWVSGHGSVRIKVLTDVSTLTLRLAASLDVSSVSSPDIGRLLALRVAGHNSLLISLPRPLTRGAEVTFDVTYSGRLVPQSLNGEAIRVNGQTQVGQNPIDTGPSIMLLPEPRFLYSNNSYWYPQPTVTEYATSTMRLTVPSEYQIIASGELHGSSVREIPGPEGREDTRSVRTVEYASNRPTRYLACLISRFVPISRLHVDVQAVAPPVGRVGPAGAEGGVAEPGVSLEVVSTPRETSKARQIPSKVADMLRFYTRMLGDAPYPSFTVAVLDDNIPGGLSPPYFAAWLQPLPTTPYVWGDDPVALRGYPYFFLAHEVAHQWWGEAIGGKNYHEQWLTEGFAQYFAALYAGADRGPDVLDNLVSQMRDSAERYDSEGPIYLGYRLGHIQNESRVFRAIVYNKSAVVLHMLRRLIGDDAFFAGLRRFYQTWRFRKAGTDDLRAAFQAGTPIPLDRFFKRWVLGSTLPRLHVSAKADAAAGVAIVRIEQQGETFDLPLTVTLQYRDAPDEEVTIPVTAAVVNWRVPLKGRHFRRVAVKDDLTMADIIK